jgi:hypothetical protein
VVKSFVMMIATLYVVETIAFACAIYFYTAVPVLEEMHLCIFFILSPSLRCCFLLIVCFNTFINS